MLNKVAVGEITDDELFALFNHLRANISVVKVRDLKSLYKKLPDELKYTGPIYRGIRVGFPGDGVKLLEDKAFTTEDRRKKSRVESWTTDIQVSLSFAARANTIGVILERDIGIQDPVMVFNNQIWLWLEETVDPERMKTLMLETHVNYTRLSTYMSESEVMMAHRPNQTYRLCPDVPMVTVSTHNLYWEEEGEYFNEFINSFKEHLTPESLDAVEEATSSDRHMRYGKFLCSGNGVLRFVGWRM